MLLKYSMIVSVIQTNLFRENVSTFLLTLIFCKIVHLAQTKIVINASNQFFGKNSLLVYCKTVKFSRFIKLILKCNVLLRVLTESCILFKYLKKRLFHFKKPKFS